MKIYRVAWRDSNIYYEQWDVKWEYNVAEIITVGVKLDEDVQKIVLAWDIIDWEARRVIVIPKENITDVKTYWDDLENNSINI